MSYQSFLSDILDSKYYSLNEIYELCLTLQRNSGLKIQHLKHTSGDIGLYCPNKFINHCQFQHVFKKLTHQEQNSKYELVKSTSNHSNKCQTIRKIPKLDRIPSFQTKQRKQSHSLLTYDQNYHTETSASPLLKEMTIKKQKMRNQKLYTEQQLSLLKKQLELTSKGLLSKSTQFDSQNNKVKRIQFHCKYEHDCPYLAVLQNVKDNQIVEGQDEQDKQLFNLNVVNGNHLNSCILEQEVINYNKNTMKIDKQIQLLTKIIQENQKNTKPKDILRLFAKLLGQHQDFIYDGLNKKINKRAIKKYFDNCVAKVRSKLETKGKTASCVGYDDVINTIKENKKQRIKQKKQEEFVYKSRKIIYNSPKSKQHKKNIQDLELNYQQDKNKSGFNFVEKQKELFN